jgi:hypothetical protein
VVTGKVSFNAAKNRLVNRQLKTKTIPTLELQAITLGVEMLCDFKEDLSGNKCLLPINIIECELFTDSSISLHWLNSQTSTLEKMQKLSVFVQNRLNYIEKRCREEPITFTSVGTNENPADCMTRCLSYNQLTKSCYFNGPKFLSVSSEVPTDTLTVTIPNQRSQVDYSCSAFQAAVTPGSCELVPLEKFSSLRKLLSVHFYVLKFVNKLKSKLKAQYAEKYSNWTTSTDDAALRVQAWRNIVATDQSRLYPELIQFFEDTRPNLKDIPPLVARLNLFRDCRDGILKVKSKFSRWRDDVNYAFPVLLAPKSALVNLLIRDAHNTLAHGGCYAILAHTRKKFFVPCFFSTVKKFLKSCVVCRRFNGRAIKLNQSS